MGFRFRRRPRLGPLRLNVTERGVRSVSVKVGPFTWNPKRRRVTTNLPGSGLSYQYDYEHRPLGGGYCVCGEKHADG